MAHVTRSHPIRIRNVAAEPKRLLRTLALLWARLGSLRPYFVGTVAVLFLLAALGLWHLIAPATRSPATSNESAAAISPGVQSTAPPPPLSRRSPGEGGAIAITEVTEAEERGPRGETYIVAKIGMAPRTTTSGDNVEIRVLFFDLDANNQMHPTDAQVTYQWITQVRDWTDPTPKYLAATYLKSHPSRRSVFAKADPRRASDQLHYGGFLVRIYSDGRLQDERSKPESLIAALRTNASRPTVAPDTSDHSPAVPSTPSSRRSPAPRDEGGSPSPANSPTPTSDLPARDASLSDAGGRSPTSSPRSSQPATLNSQPSEAPLPNGIPVPNKPGFVQSPYDPKFLIDVRGFPPGTLVNDPNTNKPFRVP